MSATVGDLRWLRLAGPALALLLTSSASAFGPPDRQLTWYADLGLGLHLSWETPDPMAKAGFGEAIVGPTFMLNGGADYAINAFRAQLGLRFEVGKLPDGFFSGVDGGTFVEVAPELRVGVIFIALSLAPHFAWLDSSSQGEQRLSGYHIGLTTLGFAFRDMADLGPAAMFAILPSWIEVSYDRYYREGDNISSWGFAFRCGI